MESSSDTVRGVAAVVMEFPAATSFSTPVRVPTKIRKRFAAVIFHDLHEEVMATFARGHGLMQWRIQKF
ncbi:hypothetical protein QYF36_013285 [Acer negundo]|nr:hypothetical protein QYF36_013285 [Acer negundo]